jgi:hypothetical protein
MNILKREFSAVTKTLAAVVSKQEVFSTQFAKDSLKRMADGDLDSPGQFSSVQREQQFIEAGYRDSYS